MKSDFQNNIYITANYIFLILSNVASSIENQEKNVKKFLGFEKQFVA
jgi:hypothetical protein